MNFKRNKIQFPRVKTGKQKEGFSLTVPKVQLKELKEVANMFFKYLRKTKAKRLIN